MDHYNQKGYTIVTPNKNRFLQDYISICLRNLFFGDNLKETVRTVGCFITNIRDEDTQFSRILVNLCYESPRHNEDRPSLKLWFIGKDAKNYQWPLTDKRCNLPIETVNVKVLVWPSASKETESQRDVIIDEVIRFKDLVPIPKVNIMCKPLYTIFIMQD